MADIPLDREFWSDMLRRVARRTRGDDAEDLLHSAFLRLQSYHNRKNVENPTAFLIRAATNIWVDNYRHDQLSTSVAADLKHESQNHAPLQDEVIAARARLARVKTGLDHLSPRTREIFLMHRLHNLKYREIAEQLGISQSAVEKRIAKATLFLTEWTEGW
jgi:RNA polymerase sigma-70 factor (ECF subfamily)